MHKILPPIVHREWYTRQVEEEIAAYFREAIFGPLLEMIREAGFEPDPKDQGPPSRIPHARSSILAEALRSGRVWYADGEFVSTSFSAAISRELRALGATRDPKTGSFRLAIANLPPEIQEAVARSALRAADLNQKVLSTLRAMEGTVASAPAGLRLGPVISRMISDLDKQFNKTVDGLEAITVQPKITPEGRALIEREFSANLDLPIKDFTAAQVRELRELVEENVLAGGRPDRLAKLIEARFGIAKRKAVFLAGNETSLYLAKYREGKYKAIGARRYRWSTSHDERVRPAHRELNGKFFAWDDPPQIRGTSRRCNPGEDYNCRCVALPVIEIEQAASILP